MAALDPTMRAAAWMEEAEGVEEAWLRKKKKESRDFLMERGDGFGRKKTNEG
jgi:hypothetical protein